MASKRGLGASIQAEAIGELLSNLPPCNELGMDNLHDMVCFITSITKLYEDAMEGIKRRRFLRAPTKAIGSLSAPRRIPS
jgi:hypothetical protein